MSERRSDKHWLTRPRTLRRLRRGFGLVLAAVVMAQVFVPVPGTVPVFGSFGFAAWYGFAVCVAMIVLARLLGWLLTRPEPLSERGSEVSAARRREEQHD